MSWTGARGADVVHVSEGVSHDLGLVVHSRCTIDTHISAQC